MPLRHPVKYVYIWNREEGTQVTDAAIHCMQWTRTDCAVRFSAHSVPPRAFTPRDDKVEEVMQCTSPGQHTMSLRGESGARDAAIHGVQWMRSDNAVQLLKHCYSPRATPTRWQKKTCSPMPNKAREPGGYFFPYLLCDSSTRSPSTY